MGGCASTANRVRPVERMMDYESHLNMSSRKRTHHLYSYTDDSYLPQSVKDDELLKLKKQCLTKYADILENPILYCNILPTIFQSFSIEATQQMT